VTFEEVVESHEILCDRLQELWDYCDNHHNVSSLKVMAKKFHYNLNGQYGNKLDTT
jgi:hypothetical protein